MTTMVNLNGHETGNGGYSQGKPKVFRPAMAKGVTQVATITRVRVPVAKHRGGTTRSSEEVSVIDMERRSCAIQYQRY